MLQEGVVGGNVLWFNPSWQLSTVQPLAPMRWGGEWEKVKAHWLR